MVCHGGTGAAIRVVVDFQRSEGDGRKRSAAPRPCARLCHSGLGMKGKRLGGGALHYRAEPGIKEQFCLCVDKGHMGEHVVHLCGAW